MTDTMERTVTVTVTITKTDTGYDVVVLPDDEATPFSKSYESYPQARGYGRGLKLYRGWTLIDTTGAPNG